MDLESEGYAVDAAILPANSFGASHERKRLFFVADSCGERWARYKPVECLFITKETPQPIDGNPLVRSRIILAGDFSDLLPCDGVSIVMERDAIKGYGNSIVPQVAAEFIKAFLEVKEP